MHILGTVYDLGKTQLWHYTNQTTAENVLNAKRHVLYLPFANKAISFWSNLANDVMNSVYSS